MHHLGNDLSDSQRSTIYHACRCAFNAGKEGEPWWLVVHVLRQGLEMSDLVTHTLTIEEEKRFSELLQHLKETL